MRHEGFYIFSLYFVIILQCTTIAEYQSPWRWVCQEGTCVKTRSSQVSDTDDTPRALAACKIFCNDHGLGNLWPMPTGAMNLGTYLTAVNDKNIFVHILRNGLSDDLLREAAERFKKLVALIIPKGVTPIADGNTLDIYLVNRQPEIRTFSLLLQESYDMEVALSPGGTINATIIANTFFGLRHGLETLSQLFIYDEIKNRVLMVRDATISDNPVYLYRGILLDTARNYYDVDSIKRTIDAMASVKLNTFHWHITDTQSFPFVSYRRPSLSKLGAYSPSKVYTKQTIQEIVQYGLVRGVRVLPEFDAPAHVGEGWQDSNLTVCFNARPWHSYCNEPPCGQLNPTKPEVYDYLLDIYTDMAEAFQPDIFHMGGDEVNQPCWMNNNKIWKFVKKNKWVAENATRSDIDGFLSLWNYFQTKAQEKVYKAFGKKIPLILWTSSLTSYNNITKFLDKYQYYIQVWTTGSNPEVQRLLEKGYNLIMSNYDSLYLDCGFAAWVGSGNYWCSSYIGWQKIYDNSPRKLAGVYKDQILGGEAALWSEEADASSMDFKLWPRAAALAERLWAEPDTNWEYAEQRMLQIRERLVSIGVQAETLQPEWCYQNDNNCFTKPKKPITLATHATIETSPEKDFY